MIGLDNRLHFQPFVRAGDDTPRNPGSRDTSARRSGRLDDALRRANILRAPWL